MLPEIQSNYPRAKLLIGKLAHLFLLLLTLMPTGAKNGVIETIERTKFPFEASTPCAAFDRAKAVGVCPKDQLEKFLKDRGMNEKDFFNKLYQIEKKYQLQIVKQQEEERKELNIIWERPEQKKSSSRRSRVSFLY